jgi:acetyl esterase/lipase
MVMSFPAGGHLAGMLATRYGEAVYDAVDPADSQSARPYAAALIYPVITMTRPFAHEGSRLCLIGPSPSPEAEAANSVETLVHPAMAPVFLKHTEDDTAVPVENALMMHAALRAAGCSVALHLFETGGHGFGLRGMAGTPREVWPELIAGWGRAKGIFPGDANASGGRG